MRSNYGFSIDGVDCDLFQAAWCRPWMHLTRRGAIFVAPAQPCFIMHELDAVRWPYFDIFLSARALRLLRRVSTYWARLWLLWNCARLLGEASDRCWSWWGGAAADAAASRSSAHSHTLRAHRFTLVISRRWLAYYNYSQTFLVLVTYVVSNLIGFLRVKGLINCVLCARIHDLCSVQVVSIDKSLNSYLGIVTSIIVRNLLRFIEFGIDMK